MENIIQNYSFSNLNKRKLNIRIFAMASKILLFLLLVCIWFFLTIYFSKNFQTNRYLLTFLLILANIIFFRIALFWFDRKILIYYWVWNYEKNRLEKDHSKKEKFYRKILKICS